MNHTKNFLLLAAFGVIALLLEFCILMLNDNRGLILTIIGIISLFGGILGASISSEKVKAIVVVLLDFITYI